MNGDTLLYVNINFWYLDNCRALSFYYEYLISVMWKSLNSRSQFGGILTIKTSLSSGCTFNRCTHLYYYLFIKALYKKRTLLASTEFKIDSSLKANLRQNCLYILFGYIILDTIK